MTKHETIKSNINNNWYALTNFDGLNQKYAEATQTIYPVSKFNIKSQPVTHPIQIG